MNQEKEQVHIKGVYKIIVALIGLFGVWFTWYLSQPSLPSQTKESNHVQSVEQSPSKEPIKISEKESQPTKTEGSKKTPPHVEETIKDSILYKLVLSSIPASNITIENNLLGLISNRTVDLPKGSYTIKFSQGGYKDVIKTVEVPQQTVVSVRMKKTKQ